MKNLARVNGPVHPVQSGFNFDDVSGIAVAEIKVTLIKTIFLTAEK